MEKIRIMIVEDDEDFCRLIRRTLEQQADFEVTDICTDSSAAFEAAGKRPPELVLMDLNLSGDIQDGIDASRKLRIATDAKVLILTAYGEAETVTRACREAFASGYVVKNQFYMLVPTIRQTMQGPTPQSHLICESIKSVLSETERLVLDMILGRRNELRSAPKTIANQKTSILKKLRLKNREQLIHIFGAYEN